MHRSNQLFDHLVVRPIAFAVLRLRRAVKHVLLNKNSKLPPINAD
jgi:hypothetical protein